MQTLPKTANKAEVWAIIRRMTIQQLAILAFLHGEDWDLWSLGRIEEGNHE